MEYDSKFPTFPGPRSKRGTSRKDPHDGGHSGKYPESGRWPYGKGGAQGKEPDVIEMTSIIIQRWPESIIIPISGKEPDDGTKGTYTQGAYNGPCDRKRPTCKPELPWPYPFTYCGGCGG